MVPLNGTNSISASLSVLRCSYTTPSVSIVVGDVGELGMDAIRLLVGVGNNQIDRYAVQVQFHKIAHACQQEGNGGDPRGRRTVLCTVVVEVSQR